MIKFKTIFKALSFSFLFFFLASCATTRIPPIGTEEERFQPTEEEKEIWEQSKEEERKIKESGKLYHDPLLANYLNQVGKKLIPAEVRKENINFCFLVIKDPALNAFAYPNGVIYIHTGLLSRMENEAQLATVFGHEMTHVIKRHTLRFIHSTKNRILIANILGVAAGVGLSSAGVGGQAQQGINLGLKLGVLASVNGYGREIEKEADNGGLKLLVDAGYDPKESPRLFKILLETHGDSTRIENFFFGNHPATKWRIENFKDLLATEYKEEAKKKGLIKNTEEFQKRTRVLVRDNAVMDIEVGRYNIARASIKKVLKIQPNDPKAHFYLGKILHKTAKNPEDLKNAIKEYQLAIKYDPEYGDPYRELGTLYYQMNRKKMALEAFKKYLEVDPETEDKDQIKEYILELSE
jgi:predicted Zn-dependent protease